MGGLSGDDAPHTQPKPDQRMPVDSPQNHNISEPPGELRDPLNAWKMPGIIELEDEELIALLALSFIQGHWNERRGATVHDVNSGLRNYDDLPNDLSEPLRKLSFCTFNCYDTLPSFTSHKEFWGAIANTIKGTFKRCRSNERRFCRASMFNTYL